MSVTVVLRNPRREVEVAGGRRVKDVLLELKIIPESVLVIRGDELVTADQVVRDDDVIELRPVMSGGHRMKCRKCGAQASIELRRHNAAFCTPDFQEFFKKQIREAIRKHRMFTTEESILVAVSGGKDSLALWDVLIDEGYRTTGLYLDLGIFDYSVESKAKCERFAAARNVPLMVSTVADEIGAPVPVIKRVTRRPPCSGCGLSKRYLMNRVALEHGFPVVATGHNLDDEAATLFGSVMHWQTDALPRQSPALASTHPKLVRRVKPLYRLSERETAAYAFLQKIDYIVDECPFAKGATSIAHKEILNQMEEASPGAKHNFLFGFLEKGRAAFERVEHVELKECARCGQVTTGTLCAFCKLADQVKRAGHSEGASTAPSEASPRIGGGKAAART